MAGRQAAAPDRKNPLGSVSLAREGTIPTDAMMPFWKRTLPVTLFLLGAISGPAVAPQAALRLIVRPERVTLRLGEGQTFSAAVPGAPAAVVTWRFAEAEIGTISPTGYYRAPSEHTTPATVRLVAAARVAENAPPLTATATVLLAPVSVSVSPASARLRLGDGIPLRARVHNAPDQRVRWSVEGGEVNGRITEAGYYSPPAQLVTPARVLVRATSVADPTKSDVAAIEIRTVAITAPRREITLRLGQSARLTATVRNAANTAVEWRVLGENCGEITPAGTYTTPSQMRTPAVVVVEARSVADPTKTVQTRIRIEPVELRVRHGAPRRRGGLSRHSVPRRVLRRVVRLVLPLDPIDLLVPGPWFRGKSGKIYAPIGGTQQFSADVRNAVNTQVIWSVEGGDINGTITPEGIYTAPTTFRTPGVVHVRATAAADPSKTELIPIHIAPVLLTPPREPVVVPMGTSRLLTVKVDNTEIDALTWTVEGGERFGTVTAEGLYHPPSVLHTPATVNVRATSVADPTKSVIVPVRIPEVTVALEDTSVEVRAGQSVRLRARVRGCEGGEVAWSVVPEVGRVGPDGVYEAPADAAVEVVHVIATAQCDPSKSARATVRIRRD